MKSFNRLALPACALTIAIVAPAFAGPPLVHYQTKIETTSWEPLPPAEIAQVVKRTVLSVLSKSGAMRLREVSLDKLRQADYALQVRGRIIEDARRFTVYLTFDRGKREDVASFFATSTSGRIARQSRPVVEQQIEQTARRAAQQLARVLLPRLRSVMRQVDLPPVEGSVFEVNWEPIDLPHVAPRTDALRKLLDVRQRDGERAAAAVELGGYAFDQKAARNALEVCLLRDPSASVRIRCAQAITPAARSHVSTQRVVLAAMRREVDENALRSLVKVSQHFVGLSRLETIATWLYLLADPTTARGALDQIARLVGDEGDVPNLDIAAAACLQRRSLASDGRRSCASYLLRAMAPKRRLAVVWRYLERVVAWDGAEQSTFRRVVDSFGRRDTPREVTQRLAELLLRVAERHSAGLARGHAIYFVREHIAPSHSVIERLVWLTADPAVSRDALRAIEDIGRDAPQLAQPAAAALQRMRQRGQLRPKLCAKEPYRDLDHALKTLARAAQKARP